MQLIFTSIKIIFTFLIANIDKFAFTSKISKLSLLKLLKLLIIAVLGFYLLIFDFYLNVLINYIFFLNSFFSILKKLSIFFTKTFLII